MKRLFIGIGSNLGDRGVNIVDAAHRLAALKGVAVHTASSIYETEPVGGPPQGWYLNCVIEALSDIPPRELLRKLKGIEKKMGRGKSVRHGPRVIDLDILLYGDLVIEEKDLTIPHARLHKRPFVLTPLLEIDRDLVHPSLHKPIKELLADLGTGPAVIPFAPPPCFL
jgi:2-amino-4-hydroxy-6-hydroxymethyldihydropteridine diphosphokinase